MKPITLADVWNETRDAAEIEVSGEADLYFAKVAVDNYGSDVRDNTLAELIQIGMQHERDDDN